MLKRTNNAGELDKQIEKTVVISGWVHDVRVLGGINFILLRDRSGVVQVTVLKAKSPKNIVDIVSKLHQEDVISVKGKVVKSKIAKIGIEVIPDEIEVISKSEVPLPLDPREVTPANFDTRFNWRFLDLRKPKNILIFKIATNVEKFMREYFLKEGFIEIHTPKLMGSASESGAEVFEVEYFGRKAYLAQSPQFYKQMAMASGFDKVFEFGPAFRAEPSKTTRHQTEFTSIDVEMSWIESVEDVMEFEEDWLEYVLEKIKKENGKEIKENFGCEVIVPKKPFPRVTMREAHEITGRVPKELHDDTDLDPEGERLLGKHIMEKKKHEFVFITDFPLKVRPFYHMKPENNPNITKSFDLLWKGEEITTGAQREHRYEILKKQAKEKGMSESSIKFYLDFFKYGISPHGGLGFGLGRFVAKLLNFQNVRDAIFLPRDMDTITP